MKKNKFWVLIVLTLIIATSCVAQDAADTLFSTTLRGEIINFRALKYNRIKGPNATQNLKDIANLSVPFYLLTEKDYHHYKLNLNNSYQIIDTLESIINNFKAKGEINEQVNFQMQSIINKTNERVDLYKKSYEELLKLNEIYANELQNCIDISKKPRSSKWFRNVMWGFLGGGIVGTYIGFQAVH